MPQFDQYKNKSVDIEFFAVEDFEKIPYPDRFTLIFITNGIINACLNERPIEISAPGVLCLSMEDKLQVVHKDSISAQSFSFHPDFFKTSQVFETQTYKPSNLKIQIGLSLFQRDNSQTGVTHLSGKAYLQLLEWFFVLGTEVYAHSNALWVCRIKKYLIQILRLLEDLNRQVEQSPIDLVLDYIHTNYPQKITLEDLTNCAYLNRISLNEMFQKRCGCTAMGYLLSYRLKVAGDLLVHTDMTLDEIARSIGFQYDTYFIKQFTAKRGLSPTAFRNAYRNPQLY
ncbi:helix-turn-helix domain-containing protein [Paenibacillus sp. B01]|uniref:helix-turn-helix domain-containing protein n=1 Tax=Paenibacillus sp. B01 TaxID=2660554 RepID=UPI00129BF342|nr:AraC family transcriptional regulator [Paenibacillus sp. B01]QGG57032.1 helix-turn-helix domain-containing protein [Paenibacillus sp. B01]